MAIDSYYEFYFQGLMNGRKAEQVIHKFGHNSAATTTFAPLCQGGVWRTPQVSAATQVRVKAGNANDTAAGSGARSIMIEGRNALGEQISEIIPTAGASAGANSVNSYIRIHRAFVASSGTYATAIPATGSQAADIVIENAAGTEDWLTIDSSPLATGQSEIGAFMIPIGCDGFIMTQTISGDRNKFSDIALMQRRSALETSAPYEAAREVSVYTGISSSVDPETKYPLGPFPEFTDLFYMGKVNSGTGDLSVNFEIALVPKAT